MTTSNNTYVKRTQRDYTLGFKLLVSLSIKERSVRETRQAELAPVNGMVLELRRFIPRLGTRKLYFFWKPKLIAKGTKIGRDALFDYLREESLLVKPKRSYTKTTNSRH
ncbi:hypothetical protein VTH8203_03761 [Vibrio thalassae]|uniref:Integrase n=1 Tax=Vibrio thalassae TaxID=1243014 RepID=A0A240EPE4_9VIBR|nr:hypothetical protein VTH8203_03761 [Vibrio thalassae]